MAILMGILLAILSLAVIVAPFVRARSRRRWFEPNQAREESLARRQSIYQEIKALQLDYQLGNIDEAGFQAALRAQRLEAASLLRVQQQWEEEGLKGLSHDLEEEIQAFRQSNAGLEGTEVCSKCSGVVLPSDVECFWCGAGLDNGTPQLSSG